MEHLSATGNTLARIIGILVVVENPIVAKVVLNSLINIIKTFFAGFARKV